MKYKFKYKHKNSFFWKSKNVIGHGVDFIEEIIFQKNEIVQKTRKPIDAMILYFEDRTVYRIPEWSKYEMKLGVDWKLVQKKQMDTEAGIDVKVE